MLEAEFNASKTVIEKRKHLSFSSIPDPRFSSFKEKCHQDLLAITKHTLFYNYNRTCKKYNHSLQKHLCIVHLICASTLQMFIKQVSDETSIDLVNNLYKLVTKCFNKIVGQAELTSLQEYKNYYKNFPENFNKSDDNSDSADAKNDQNIVDKCSKETALNYELYKKAKHNSVLIKAYHIDYSVSEYNINIQYDLFNDGDFDTSTSENITMFNPATIIRLGLKDIKIINTIMNTL
ncbi:8063_t:CDS:2 [Cetraspora pellucida]|uniref:8063_t:CDS:1 n=1 Tax=Cetraspora pellucida TaxID=1433469 RepID=A0A9N9GVV6_9GLOM|nr:8063_t:CDS:2 [Cetraspora pellucida]